MWKRPVRVTSKAYLRSYFLRLFHPLHLSRPILNRSVCSRWFCVFYPKFVHLEVCVCRHEWLYIGWGWFCIFSEARGRSWRLNLQFRRPRCSQTVSRPSMVQSLMQALCTQPPPPPLPLLAMLLTCPPYPPDGETWTEDNFRDASSEPTQDIFKNKLVLSGFYEIMHVWLEIYKTEKNLIILC